ncbi:MAG: hypothetical protein AB8G05_23155 [Oligoflexales bacterium]
MNLFTIIQEFNRRYDSLNDNLEKIIKNPQDSVVVYDYFNLCAEEYYFYSRGLIPSEIWRVWFSGMEEKFNCGIIQRHAIKEFTDKKNQYYGFSPFELGLLGTEKKTDKPRSFQSRVV